MSIYLEIDDVGTTYEQMERDAGGTVIDGLSYSPGYGQARVFLQNDGAQAMTWRMRRRPNGNSSDHTAPQWQSYDEETISLPLGQDEYVGVFGIGIGGLSTFTLTLRMKERT